MQDIAPAKGKHVKQLRDATISSFRNQSAAIEHYGNATRDDAHQLRNEVQTQINDALANIAQRVDNAPQVNVFGPLMSQQSSPLSSYTGKTGADFRNWLRRFEDVVAVAQPQIADGDKIKTLLAFLDQTARDRAEELMTANTTYDELVTGLKNAFDDPQRKEIARQQLRQIRQRQGECIEDYSNRVKALARLATTGQTRAITEEKCQEAFVEGLNFDIRFHVKAASPNSFQEAVNRALHFENLLGEVTRAGTITPGNSEVSQALVNLFQNMSHRDSTPNQVQSQPNRRDNSYQNPSNNRQQNAPPAFDGPPNTQHGGRNFGNNRRTGRYQGGNGERTPLGNIRCYRCGHVGHYQWHCPFDNIPYNLAPPNQQVTNQRQYNPFQQHQQP